jgi:hypothetical protein
MQGGEKEKISLLSKYVYQFLHNVRNTARQICLCALTFLVFPMLQEGKQIIHVIDIKRT